MKVVGTSPGYIKCLCCNEELHASKRSDWWRACSCGTIRMIGGRAYVSRRKPT